MYTGHGVPYPWSAHDWQTIFTRSGNGFFCHSRMSYGGGTGFRSAMGAMLATRAGLGCHRVSRIASAQRFRRWLSCPLGSSPRAMPA